MSEQEPIRNLIERSSLGSPDARAARATVPAKTGRTIARAAVSGRYVSTVLWQSPQGGTPTVHHDPKSRQGSASQSHLHEGTGRSNPDQPF